jgi:hypothetical protein
MITDASRFRKLLANRTKMTTLTVLLLLMGSISVCNMQYWDDSWKNTEELTRKVLAIMRGPDLDGHKHERHVLAVEEINLYARLYRFGPDPFITARLAEIARIEASFDPTTTTTTTTTTRPPETTTPHIQREPSIEASEIDADKSGCVSKHPDCTTAQGWHDPLRTTKELRVQNVLTQLCCLDVGAYTAKEMSARIHEILVEQYLDLPEFLNSQCGFKINIATIPLAIVRGFEAAFRKAEYGDADCQVGILYKSWNQPKAKRVAQAIKACQGIAALVTKEPITETRTSLRNLIREVLSQQDFTLRELGNPLHVRLIAELKEANLPKRILDRCMKLINHAQFPASELNPQRSLREAINDCFLDIPSCERRFGKEQNTRLFEKSAVANWQLPDPGNLTSACSDEPMGKTGNKVSFPREGNAWRPFSFYKNRNLWYAHNFRRSPSLQDEDWAMQGEEPDLLEQAEPKPKKSPLYKDGRPIQDPKEAETRIRKSHRLTYSWTKSGARMPEISAVVIMAAGGSNRWISFAILYYLWATNGLVEAQSAIPMTPLERENGFTPEDILKVQAIRSMQLERREQTKRPIQALLLNNSVDADFVVTAYDCSEPQNVRDVTFYEGPVCDRPSQVVKMRNESYQLLMREEHIHTKGFSCALVQTQTVHYCGNADHQTFMDEYSYFEIAKPMSLAECRRAWDRNQYKDPSPKGTVHELNPRAYTDGIRYLLAGNSEWDGSEGSCDGGEFRTPFKTLQGVVVTVYAKILLQEERYVMQDGQTLLAKVRGSTLPVNVNAGHYLGVKATFVWDIPSQEDMCLLANTKIVTGTVATTKGHDEVFVSTDGSLIRLVLKGTMGECGRMVIATNYPNLYLYPSGWSDQFKRKIQPGELRLKEVLTYVNTRDDVVYHSIKEMIQEETNFVLQNDCNQQFERARMNYWLTQREPSYATWSRGKNVFATPAGESIVEYECAQIYVQAVQADRCYMHIPVQFIDPRTNHTIMWFCEKDSHRMTMLGIEVPCNERYPSKYKNFRGEYFTVYPTLQRVPAPQSSFKPEDRVTRFPKAPDWSKMGIFSEEDIRIEHEFQEQGNSILDTGFTLLAETRRSNNEVYGTPGGTSYTPSYEGGGGSYWPPITTNMATHAWNGFWQFAQMYGSLASVFMTIYVITRLVLVLLQLMYRVFLIHDVHGCARQLLYAPCLSLFFLRNYRKMEATRGRRRRPSLQSSGQYMSPMSERSRNRRSRSLSPKRSQSEAFRGFRDEITTGRYRPNWSPLPWNPTISKWVGETRGNAYPLDALNKAAKDEGVEFKEKQPSAPAPPSRPPQENSYLELDNNQPMSEVDLPMSTRSSSPSGTMPPPMEGGACALCPPRACVLRPPRSVTTAPSQADLCDEPLPRSLLVELATSFHMPAEQEYIEALKDKGAKKSEVVEPEERLYALNVQEYRQFRQELERAKCRLPKAEDSAELSKSMQQDGFDNEPLSKCWSSIEFIGRVNLYLDLLLDPSIRSLALGELRMVLNRLLREEQSDAVFKAVQRVALKNRQQIMLGVMHPPTPALEGGVLQNEKQVAQAEPETLPTVRRPLGVSTRRIITSLATAKAAGKDKEGRDEKGQDKEEKKEVIDTSKKRRVD